MLKEEEKEIMGSEYEKSSLRLALIQISDGSASASGFSKERISRKEDGILSLVLLLPVPSPQSLASTCW
ncbi:hypothetical protein Patl1_19719 [Pistacia atlantica]|uniref:Uncharacterized protein n=1 Tax=Pistacia atlantica TaxID=434234 RepID=A0ACC1C401_9ROSI|nr:hypothetical protein Patl1_19719 [Pistacia atlantica]